MNTHIALLRGINLGPRRKVPMADLRDLAESLGLLRPTTYIQSGNLVFEADPHDAGVASRLETALEQRFGFDIPVVIRAREELAQVAGSHPLATPQIEERFLMVAFLERVPEVAVEDAITAEDFLPDRFLQAGRDVYLAYENGQGRSKLSHDLLERRLGVRATIRNWRTILRLVELSSPDARS